MARMDLTVDGQTESGGVRVATGAQPQDGTDWQPYGVNKAGQQVWAQTLGPGDPDLQTYIANGAQGSGLSYQPTTTGSNPGLIRAPDMVNFQVSCVCGVVAACHRPPAWSYIYNRPRKMGMLSGSLTKFRPWF
jgi:filamentous hemagglutinin